MSSKSDPAKSKATLAERIEHAGRTWFKPWWLAGLALLSMGILLGPRIIRALPSIENRPEYQLHLDGISVSEIPVWVPKDIVRQALTKEVFVERTSVLNEDLVKRIAIAFRQHPWVEKVLKVTKSVPAHVDVELIYRRPVAMVEVPNGLLPVDRLSVLLPPGDFAADVAQKYPLITRAKTSPRSGVGKAWGDPQVAAASKLAEVLLPHWNDFRLTEIEIPVGIDLTAPPEEIVFQLHSQGGSRIIWGRAPEVAYPLELTAEQKIGRLEECLTRFGGFDQPDGPYEIDIRHFQEITRVRLTAQKETRQRIR